MGKTLIKTISIPLELQDFLDDNPDLSLSKICQSKLIEIRENRRHRFGQEKNLRESIKKLQIIIERQGDTIDVLEKKAGK